MKILMRKCGANWTQVNEHKFENEGKLQHILYESPEVIPITSLGEEKLQPKVFVREAGLPGSGSTDLIGVDEQGGITIIECKLAANPDIRRKVVGQLLEYAAFLWTMDYEQFDRTCCRAEKWQDRHLVDVMRERIDADSIEWSEELFISGVTDNLKSGNFTLIIAVDRLNDELRRIIEYLNSRGPGTPKISALEVLQFEAGDTQLLVPQMFGTTAAPPPPPPGMDEETLLSGASTRFIELYYGVKNLAARDAFKSSSFTHRGFALRIRGHGNLLVLAPASYVRMWISPSLKVRSVDDEANQRLWQMLGSVRMIRPRLDRRFPEFGVTDESWTPEEVQKFLKALAELEDSADVD